MNELEQKILHAQHMIDVNEKVIKALEEAMPDVDGATKVIYEGEIKRAQDFISELARQLIAYGDEQERIHNELAMYGTTVDKMVEMFEKGSPDNDRELWAISLLSDAQHAIEYNDPERARQWINQAKWFIRNE